jgi:transposase
MNYSQNQRISKITESTLVIAQLVKDGRYSVPYFPNGVYAELREAVKIRDDISCGIQRIQGKVHNWLDRYFPEFLEVFASYQ